ncbi:MAG: acyl-CoA synthetase [Hyphomicrobiales bacterium]
MLPGRMNYEDLLRRFEWKIPDAYNLGHDLCDRWAEREPDRLALIHVRDDGKAEDYSFGRLRAMSNRLANVLAARGVGRGDRIALLLPQVPETAIAHIAVYKLGAVAVPMAELFGVDALEYRLSNSGAKVLITSTGSLAKIAEIRNRLPDLQAVFSIDGAGDGADDMHADMDAASDRCATAATGPDSPAVMVYTSGTTGPPKGALHGHRVLLGHLPGVQFSHEFLPQPGDRMWTPSDWAWAGGLFNVMMAALHCGVPVVAHRFVKFEPERAFALIAGHGIRNALVPPTALKMMRAVPDPAARHALDLRTLFSGGETVGRELNDWTGDVFGLKINEVYGQTECNLVLGSCAEIGVWRPGAIGKPVPGHTVAIVNDAGEGLPAGEVGHIAVQRPDPVMFLEYWGRPDATREKYAGDWLLTGDQGSCDEDGYFHFVGRGDDVITSAGYRIGPGEIEDCLIGHPAIALAAVVGKPDPVRTEIVKAFVVLNAGHEPSDALASEISAHVRDRLAAHEYPREISFEDSLPLTTTGKVIRRLLRERA